MRSDGVRIEPGAMRVICHRWVQVLQYEVRGGRDQEGMHVFQREAGMYVFRGQRIEREKFVLLS